MPALDLWQPSVKRMRMRVRNHNEAFEFACIESMPSSWNDGKLEYSFFSF